VDKAHGLNSAMNADSSLPHQTGPSLAERSSQPEKPGALQGQVWLTVQTSQAQQLIHGRAGTPDKPAIIGLVGFADRLRVIWLAARRDDPYADWWLIKVHEGIEANETFVRHRQVELDKHLEQMTGMEVNVASSQRPYRVHLKFANPYAYRAAQLLARYDQLVCTALTARHIGLRDGAAYVQVQQACVRKLRALFMIPQGYRMLKIDRDMVRKQTGRSHEARQIMGEVPDDVLSGERHAPLVPSQVKFPFTVTGHVGLHPASTVSSAIQPDDGNPDG
jgi:integrating conjugative element protein (TIGR03761 family)